MRGTGDNKDSRKVLSLVPSQKSAANRRTAVVRVSLLLWSHQRVLRCSEAECQGWVIDLGSNSTKVLVASVSNDGDVQKIG